MSLAARNGKADNGFDGTYACQPADFVRLSEIVDLGNVSFPFALVADAGQNGKTSKS